jgi:hypothetical protein
MYLKRAVYWLYIHHSAKKCSWKDKDFYDRIAKVLSTATLKSKWSFFEHENRRIGGS